LLPYVIRSFQEMEKKGLGRPLPELQGRRGQFKIQVIRAIHPFTGEQQILWEKEINCPIKPQLCVTSDDIIEHAEALPRDQIAIQFLTPTRLIFDNHLVKHPSFRVLTLRLAERFNALRQAYTVEANDSVTKEALDNNRAWYQKIDTWAKEVRLLKDETHWEDIQSYSARQRKTTPIGGFIGKATYEGDLTHLRELLVWGEVFHVGKNIVKGNGMYRIEA
jgi:CRISPR-associated endoribonuclease Cas6